MDVFVLYLQTPTSFPSSLRGFESRLPLHVFKDMELLVHFRRTLNAVMAHLAAV